MSRKHFGTDGIRGVANDSLTPELALSLGQAAGRWILDSGLPKAIVMGRDTRQSGPMLGAALASGFCSVGVDVVALGVVPTPTVSFAARHGDFAMGVVISASHNPAPDNGIKLMGHDGRKLTDGQELAIEELMDQPVIERPTGERIGKFSQDRTLVEQYLQFLETIVPDRLAGLKVAVDAANGAAFELGPEILSRLGANVVSTGINPDGNNINEEGGATKPATVGDLTVSSGSDVGVAFDGDADRAVFSDEKGRLINGDRSMGLWASQQLQEGNLNPKVVVGTVMSNGGFEDYLDRLGINLVRAPVGDKYVSQQIVETGARVGGEQSGHIIFPHHGPTGDGLVTMLETLRAIQAGGRKASQYLDDYESWPQLLINVTVDKREGWREGPRMTSALADAEAHLAGRGRINVRPSGTQPMIRVMVEADRYETRDSVAEELLNAMKEELGGKVYSRVDLTHALGD